MAENVNPLIIPIGADINQFQKSIDDVKVEFKTLYDLIASTPFNLVKAEDKKQFQDLKNILADFKTNLKEVGDAAIYPANSIKGIKNEIDKLNRTKLTLDAEKNSAELGAINVKLETLQQRLKKINDTGLNKLQNDIVKVAEVIKFPENSIQGIKNKIDQLNKKKIILDAKTSAKEIIELNREIDRLKDKLTNINNLGSASGGGVGSTLPNSFDNVTNSGKKARIALTSLTLVAQDLPFGLIAIQNNIPNLLQAFQGLRTETGSNKKAFAELANTLQGPVGALFALSAGLSIVTFLTQKYGSLGNAIDALIGKSVSLESIQTKLNKGFDNTVKSTAGEIANLNSLVGILTNANAKKEQQLGAYDELNKKYPGFLFNIDRENTATALSSKLIAERTRLIAQQITLEGRRNALIELIGESAKEGEKALRGIVTQGKDLSFFEKVLLGIRGTFAGIGGAGVLNILSADLGNAAKETQFFNSQLDIVNSSLTETNNIQNELIKSQDELDRKRKEAAKAATKAAKDAAKASIGTITQGEALNNGVITSDIGLLTKIIEANVRLTNLAVDRIRRYRDKEEIKPLDLMPKKLDKKAGVPMSAELEKQVGATLLQLDALSNKFAQTNEALQSAFFEPLSSAFQEFFETGKLGFKEFGKSIINTIKQIVAKIIATGIINLLASILSGGSTSLAGGVASAAKGINIGRAFGDAFKSVLGIGGNKVAAPSFSGVGSGGMQMQGQVVFVQRGSDLVGVLNRTNGTINRVG